MLEQVISYLFFRIEKCVNILDTVDRANRQQGKAFNKGISNENGFVPNS